MDTGKMDTVKIDSVKVSVKDMNGKEVDSLELDGEVFGIVPKASLVHETVRWQRAKRRSGTHSVLTRSNMKGGGKKPWKQKGTGRARSGSNNSPLWVGGAVVHGPSPKKYDFRLPKRTRRQAMASVLSDKVSKERLVVLNDLQIESGKTRDMAGVLKNIGVEGKSAVILLAQENGGVQRSSRNLPKVLTLAVEGANVYDLLKHQFLVGTPEALLKLQERVHPAKISSDKAAQDTQAEKA